MYESAISLADDCRSEAKKVEEYRQTFYAVTLLEMLREPFEILATERRSEVESWKFDNIFEIQNIFEDCTISTYLDERYVTIDVKRLVSLLVEKRMISDEMLKIMLEPMSEPELKNTKKPMPEFEPKKIPDSIAKPMPKPKPKPMPKPKPCSACKAYRCQCIEVCRICKRPITKALQPCL